MSGTPALNLEYIFSLIYEFFVGADASSFADRFFAFWSVYQGVALVLSLLFLFGIVYSTVRLHQLRAAEEGEHKMMRAKAAAMAPDFENEKWKRVTELVLSDNPSDWRLSIIEADVMLEDMISHMGYVGADFGEKLKGIEQSDFTTIELAWEAHKVRNQIAHTGTDFVLTQREARRIIDLYRQVFEEFKYI